VSDRGTGVEGSEAVAAPALRRLSWPGLLVIACAGCGTGANEHFRVESRLLGRSLEQAAIVPSGDTSGRPLLVLLHGRSSSPDSMAKKSFGKALDDLGSRAPVVVFANGGDHSYYHDRSDGRWGSYILDEVIPAAIRKYDLDPRRVAIGGFSMGGFGALDLARFRRFCAVGGHSAAMWRTGGETPQGAFDDDQDFEQNDVIEAAARNPRLYGKARVWIDVGTEDPFRSADEELARRLSGERFVMWKGGHDFSHFERDAPRVMKFYADALTDC
jgi:poly(3-hydroxybutyrate) depolymerase